MKQQIQAFLNFCKVQKNLSDKTLYAYLIDLNQFNLFCDNSKLIYTEKKGLEKYLFYLSSCYKVASIKRKIATLKAFFGYLEFEEIISENPCRKLQLRLKEPVVLPRTLTFNEMNRLFMWLYQQKATLDKSNDTYRLLVRDLAVIELLFFTGMRVAELCNVKRGDLDLQEGIVRVNGKGSRERLLYVGNPQVISTLKEYKALFENEMIQGDFFL